jgi:hypothetical protein
VKKFLTIFCLCLCLGVGVAVFMYQRFQKAGEIARDTTKVELSHAEIRTGIRSPELAKRLDAVEQLGKLSVEERREVLVDALGAAYAPTRLTAITALRKEFVGDAAVVERLLAVAREDLDGDVREGAFAALRESGDARTLALCVEVVQSSAPLAVRLAAAETLDELCGREEAAPLAEKFDEAAAAADDLGMGWEEWLGARREKLTWDAEKKRFVERP